MAGSKIRYALRRWRKPTARGLKGSPMKRTYRKPQSSGQYCEHCDSPSPNPTRRDYLRGWTCRDCDTALNAMEAEGNRHTHGQPCPLTGEPIPGEQIFTEHSRAGCFNACGACSSDKRTIAERLRDLNDRRKLDRES